MGIRQIITLSMLGAGLIYAAPALANKPAKVATTAKIPVFEAGEGKLGFKIDGTAYEDMIDLPLTDFDLNVGSGNEPNETCILQREKSLCFTLQPGETKKVALIFKGKRDILQIHYYEPAANFPPAYRKKYRGTIRAENTPAYELVNVAIALTEKAKADKWLIPDSPYSKKVRETFAQLSSHPFVLALNAEMTKDDDAYHELKMNGAAFDLSPANKVTQSKIYRAVGWSGANELLPFRKEMEDFARKAKFMQFYQANSALYKDQQRIIETEMGAPAMYNWLRREYPDVAPYSAVKIYFSPLVESSQSLATLGDDEFSELQPHIDYQDDKIQDNMSKEAWALWSGIILFTEMNHGFINDPIARDEGLSKQMSEIFTCRAPWVDPEVEGYYPGPSPLFNELMNWGLMSVRALDELPAEQAAEVAAQNNMIMESDRSFNGFGVFQDVILEAAKARPIGKDGKRAPFSTTYGAILAKLKEKRASMPGAEKCAAPTPAPAI